jgi:integrase
VVEGRFRLEVCSLYQVTPARAETLHMAFTPAFYGICWIEAGLAPKTVQMFVSHATQQMTADTYGHVFPSEITRWTRLAGGYLREFAG